MANDQTPERYTLHVRTISISSSNFDRIKVFLVYDFYLVSLLSNNPYFVINRSRYYLTAGSRERRMLNSRFSESI
jgi:hypothetical protein